MFSFFLLLIFLYSGYVAYRRGLRYQALSAVGFLISLIIAIGLYRPLSQILNLWIPYPSASRASHFAFFDQTTGLNLDKSFYAAVSYILLVLVFNLVWHLILSGFNDLRFVESDAKVDKWGAILLSVIMTQITCFLILFILATIPMNGLQTMLEHSHLAGALLRDSPGITPFYINLFVHSV